jgi:hypothetical protein
MGTGLLLNNCREMGSLQAPPVYRSRSPPESIEKPVHIHDMHTAVLQLLDLESTKRTIRCPGRHMRPTQVKTHVLHELLA